MPTPRFDIFRRDEHGSLVWLETATQLETAKNRMETLFAVIPGEYLVFDQQRQQMVARVSTDGKHNQPTSTATQQEQ